MTDNCKQKDIKNKEDYLKQFMMLDEELEEYLCESNIQNEDVRKYLKHALKMGDAEQGASNEKGDQLKKRIEAAFWLAVDNRKLEIELYWKRATYFWALLGAAFIGFGVVYNPDEPGEPLSLTFACLGFVLSLSWYLANLGSKQWQENWENHVDHLEDLVVGPLHKLLFERTSAKNFNQRSDHWFTRPRKFSVSKINTWVSFYVTVTWFLIILAVLFQGTLNNDDRITVDVCIFYTIVVLATIIAVFFLFMYSKTYVKSHDNHVDKRWARIVRRQ